MKDLKKNVVVKLNRPFKRSKVYSKTMVFIKTMLLLCCLQILLTIVMPINCNKFNSKIDQSLKRYPRQVNANNDQQIGANNTHPVEKKENFGTLMQSAFDGHQGVKNVMHDKSSGPVVLPGRNNERRGRQLNIYTPAQASNNYNYQDYASQPWYLANKDYYDNYYANYYQSYYQTSTEPIRQTYQQPYPSQMAVQSNFQSSISQQQHHPSQEISQSKNRLNDAGTSTLPLSDNNGDSTIYIDENGLFQISKSNALSAVSPVADDDAIVFQSDESQYDRKAYHKHSRMHDGGSNSKPISFNGLPVFS